MSIFAVVAWDWPNWNIWKSKKVLDVYKIRKGKKQTERKMVWGETHLRSIQNLLLCLYLRWLLWSVTSEGRSLDVWAECVPSLHLYSLIIVVTPTLELCRSCAIGRAEWSSNRKRNFSFGDKNKKKKKIVEKTVLTFHISLKCDWLFLFILVCSELTGQWSHALSYW